MAESDGGETLTLEPGDFAWALGKGDLWWPGRIRSPSDLSAKVSMDRPSHSPAALYLSCFGDGGSGWHENPSSTLAPFLPTSFASQTSPSKAFSRALSSAATAFSRCLESHLTCSCTPDAKFKTNAPVSISNVVANSTPEEILNVLRGFAIDVSSGTLLDVAVSRAWVAAFARGTGTRHVPLTEFAVHRGIPQERSAEGDGVEARRKGKMKQRSMAELIADLDLETDGEGSTIVREGDGDWKGASDGVCSGRRERKKSKYLSPPYTLVNLKGRSIWGKGSEKKMGVENCEGEDEVSEKVNSRSRQRFDLYWDEKDFVLDEKSAPVSELVTEMRLVALDVLLLEGGELEREIRGFFGRYRRTFYGGEGDDEVVGSDDKEEKLPTAANGYAAGGKQTVRKKKKSIGGILGKSEQVPKLSGRKRALGSSEEAGGLSGGKNVQKRKKEKEDVVSCGKNDDPQVVGVAGEGDAGEGGETGKKKTKKNRRMKEEANVNELVRPMGNGGKSVKKGGEEEEQGDVDVGSGEGKSNRKTGDGKKEEVNGDFASVVAVPVILEATGKEKKGTPTVPVGFGTNGPQEGTFAKKATIKRKVAARAHVDVGKVNGEDKPKQKRQRKKEGTDASSGDGGSGRPKQEEEEEEKKKDEEGNPDNGAAILLSFLKGVDIPSKEELISTYSRYGTLRESEMVLMKECSSASVVFARKSDAEKALHCEDRDRSNEAACQIQYLHGDLNIPNPNPNPPQSAAAAAVSASSTPKPPLEYVKKSLESMITTLATSGVPIGGLLDGEARPESKENLVDEMSGLLKKVTSLLNARTSSGSTSGAAT